MERLLRFLLLPVSGVLFGLAFPRTSWWPLALLSLVPLLLRVCRPGGMPPALAGLAWGAGFFGTLLSWLYGFFRHYGQLDPVLSFATLAILVAYLSLYPALFAHFGSLLLQRHGAAALGLLPALWVALEWIRGRALGGFPWGLAGYSLVPFLPLVQIASVTGVTGVSFLVVSANLAAASWIEPLAGGRRTALRLSVSTVLLFAGTLAFGYREMSLPAGDGPPVRVGLVQAAIPQDKKWSGGEALEILDKHERLTAEAVAGGARLVLWPESSSPFPLSYPAGSARDRTEADPNRSYRVRMEALSARTGASILFGTVDYRRADGEVRPVNAAALVRPDGSWGETYAKMHLVPFGEYVPLAPLLGFVNRIARGAIGDFLPGDRAVVVRADGLSPGTGICYEMVFPELVRRFPLSGADLLANVTNDAWFGTSSGPHQHFQMAVLRAVENRRFLVRAANTGISAIVDPRGRVLERTGLEETRVLIGEVRPVRSRTFYTRAGDVFPILCVILTAAALAAAFAPWPRSIREEKVGD